MKRLLYICIYLLAIASLAGCQQKSKETEVAMPRGPFAQIEFPEGTDYNTGNYYEKVIQEHGYPVYNPGKIPLVIDSVITFCGCTSASAPKKPILSGETDTIYVRYDGNGFVEGTFVKHIRVFSNAENSVDLTFRGAYFDPQ